MERKVLCEEGKEGKDDGRVTVPGPVFTCPEETEESRPPVGASGRWQPIQSSGTLQSRAPPPPAVDSHQVGRRPIVHPAP
jgi:hypothetical protein